MNIDLDHARNRLTALEGCAKLQMGFDGHVSARLNVVGDTCPTLLVHAGDKDINTEPGTYRLYVVDNHLSLTIHMVDDVDFDAAVERAFSAIYKMPSRQQREMNILAVKCQQALSNDQQFLPEVRERVINALRAAFTEIGLPMITHRTDEIAF